MRRLFPDPGETTIEEELGRLGLIEMAHDDRPYLVTNFVLTLDGRATLHGRSGPIGSPTDTALLQLLRTQADAVMIGAGTLRVERYGRIVPDPALRSWRERIGLAHDPLAVIVSGRLDLPWDAPLFTNGWGRVIVFTASDADPPETATSVRVVRHEGMVDLPRAMRTLREERGVRAVVCEGGPHLHAELIAAGLVDELFVTHAAKLAGGDGPHLVSGLAEAERPLELHRLVHDEESGELFARYRVLPA